MIREMGPGKFISLDFWSAHSPHHKRKKDFGMQEPMPIEVQKGGQSSE